MILLQSIVLMAAPTDQTNYQIDWEELSSSSACLPIFFIFFSFGFTHHLYGYSRMRSHHCPGDASSIADAV